MVNAAKGVQLGLRSHPINDARKYYGSATRGANRKKGTHCEMMDESADVTTELLLAALKSEKFAATYGAKMRLNPVMDWRLTKKTN
mmetsp:Transcript_35496/g.105990  ORF Transcript_35496/g.105990 Transcript_35496/m.105990 type:complete len:86 (-) Transcript_35496:203-460(-)